MNFVIDAEISEGESIESKVEKMLAGKEKVELTRSLEYQERRAGVEPQYNIRADRHEILREAVAQSTEKYFEARKIRQNERKPLDQSHGGEPTRTPDTSGGGE